MQSSVSLTWQLTSVQIRLYLVTGINVFHSVRLGCKSVFCISETNFAFDITIIANWLKMDRIVFASVGDSLVPQISIPTQHEDA